MTHLSKSTNNTESSDSDIGRPTTLCLKLCTREPQAHLQETGHGQGCQAWLCYPSLSIMTYCNGIFWVSDPSTEPHDGRFHRTVVFCTNKTSYQPVPSLGRDVWPASATVTGLRLYETTSLLNEQVLWDSKVLLLRKNLWLTALSAVIHYCNSSVEARCGREGMFYILLIKSQSFSGSVSWTVTFTSVSPEV